MEYLSITTVSYSGKVLVYLNLFARSNMAGADPVVALNEVRVGW